MATPNPAAANAFAVAAPIPVAAPVMNTVIVVPFGRRSRSPARGRWDRSGLLTELNLVGKVLVDEDLCLGVAGEVRRLNHDKGIAVQRDVHVVVGQLLDHRNRVVLLGEPP